MDYLAYKGEKWPVRVSYYALKQYQVETGKSVDTIDQDIANLEILLHYAIIAGCKADNKEMTLTREDMEFFLDESLSDFNKVLMGSFGDSVKGAVKGTSKKN